MQRWREDLRKCIPHQCWTKIASSDTHIDDVCELLSGCSNNLSVTHASGKVCHQVPHTLHLFHHIYSIDNNFVCARCAQRNMQCGLTFRRINWRSCKHRVSVARHRCFISQLKQCVHNFRGDVLLGKISDYRSVAEVEIKSITRGALGIAQKQPAQG